MRIIFAFFIRIRGFLFFILNHFKFSVLDDFIASAQVDSALRYGERIVVKRIGELAVVVEEKKPPLPVFHFVQLQVERRYEQIAEIEQFTIWFG